MPGNCYFHVNYFDTKLTVPHVQTLIYRRCEADDDGERLWLFEEPDGLIDEEPSAKTPVLVGFRDKNLHAILDFDRLIATLSERALDHPITPSPARQSRAGLSEPQSERLKNNIRDLLKDPDWRAVTITISYTDDGFSLSRGNDGGYEIHFFTHTRRDLTEETRILGLFTGIGTKPHVDYLSDYGRTRVLAFAISDSPVGMFDLCVRVFTEVHGVRDDDELDFSFLPMQSAPG